MAGVEVESGGGGGGRRTANFEVNMIPMIDLLMVTISFLLITAVWTQMSRIDANAQVPGPPKPCEDGDCCDGNCPQDRKLHVSTVDGQKFVLQWKQGHTVVSTTEVDASGSSPTVGSTRYPSLAAAIVKEWQSSGVHRGTDDKAFDRAVVHASNDLPYSTIVGVMDAVSAPKRIDPRHTGTPAFEVSLAMD
jgi:biopolymer transport protein ExbD